MIILSLQWYYEGIIPESILTSFKTSLLAPRNRMVQAFGFLHFVMNVKYLKSNQERITHFYCKVCFKTFGNELRVTPKIFKKHSVNIRECGHITFHIRSESSRTVKRSFVPKRSIVLKNYSLSFCYTYNRITEEIN